MVRENYFLIDVSGNTKAYLYICKAVGTLVILLFLYLFFTIGWNEGDYFILFC